MIDPLGLNAVPTPDPVRTEQTAPPDHIISLYNRVVGAYSADAPEVKLLLLAHLVYLTYRDLKDTCTK